jgi:ATP-dependent Lon protease
MLSWNVEDLTFDADRFNGVVRLFPLPDLVMFPNVMQPLHVFEPQYRDLLNDALDSDGLIAMSVLAPQWAPDDLGRPAILPQVCIGKVVSHHRLDDGRYNIMLLGLKRARIVRELPSDRSFRKAEVELLEDEYSLGEDSDRSATQQALAARFEGALPLASGAAIDDSVRKMLATEVPLGVLTDLASFALPLDAPLKFELLAQCDVDRRAAMLLEKLGGGAMSDKVAPSAPFKLPPAATRFPPPLSQN